jgi:hypothetical protein
VNGRDLLAAATPRPWYASSVVAKRIPGGNLVEVACEGANAALIVAAVNEYEALLDIAEFVRREIAGWGGHSEANNLLARLDAVRSGT